MKLMKQLFSSLFIAGAMLSTQALAEEKTAEQAQPQTQVQQQTAVQAPSQTVQQTVSDKLNINTASASDIQKALIGIGAKKAEAIVQYREKHGNFTVAEQLLEVQGIGKATLEKNRDRIVFLMLLFLYEKRNSDIPLFYFLSRKFTKTCKISNFFGISWGFLAMVL